jgi:predicted  nucleic acid-binding Zn-ribbon protein
MKTFLTFLSLLLFFSGITKAQQPIEINEESISFQKSSIPGFSVRIPEANYEETVKNWVKLLQSGTKSKVVNDNGQMSIFGAKIKDISDTPVNVYSSIERVDSSVNLKTAFELRKDEYAGAAEKENARKYLMDFAKDQYLSVVKNQLNTEKNNLNKLEKDLASLERDQKKLEKTNRDNYTLISSENGRLDALNNQLASLTAEMNTRTNPNANTGMGASSDNDPGKVKDLNKEIKKTGKEIKDSEKRISKAEKEIADNKREIPGNIENQNDARMKVSHQQAVVQQLEDKLERIKNFK